MDCKRIVRSGVPRLLVVALLIVLKASSACFSQEQFSKTNEIVHRGKESFDPSSFNALLSKISACDLGKEEAWKALLAVNFFLDSKKSANGFYFEQIVYGPGDDGEKTLTRKFLRFLLDSDGQRVASVLLGPQQLPVTFMCEDHFFSLTENAKWNLYEGGHWAFVVDGDHLNDYYDASAAPENVLGYLRLDMASSLQWIFEEETPQISWDAVSRTLRLDKSTGAQVKLRFRSPSDTLRYGTTLGEMCLQSSNGYVLSSQAFQTKANSRTRLTLANTGDLARVLNAQKLTDGKLSATSVDTQEKREASLKLWGHISTFKPIDLVEVIIKKKEEGHNDLTLREHGYLLYAIGMKAGVATEKDQEYDSLYVAAVAKHLRAMAVNVDKHLPKGTTFPDDPIMLRRELEAEFGSHDLGLLESVVIVPLLTSPATTLQQKAALCDAWGDCGVPPLLGDGSAYAEIMKDPLLDTILRTHWQWTCTPAHREACFDTLETAAPNSEMERVVIETLMRLDQTDQMPEEKLERWWAKHITSASDAVRRQSLSILSLQPTGRDCLLQRLQEKTDTDTLRQHVARNLRHRAESTIKTQRFEFMPRRKCDEILTLTEDYLP